VGDEDTIGGRKASLTRGDARERRPQLGNAEAGLAAGRQNLGMRRAMLADGGFGSGDGARHVGGLEPVGLGQHELVAGIADRVFGDLGNFLIG